jgi:hypothetical protein
MQSHEVLREIFQTTIPKQVASDLPAVIASAAADNEVSPGEARTIRPLP